jgi:hypothetical protein
MSNAATADPPTKPPTSKKPAKIPDVKFNSLVRFNPEGNTAAPLNAIACSEVSHNGRLELIVLPANGGECVRKYGVVHESKFSELTNPKVRQNGSWS